MKAKFYTLCGLMAACMALDATAQTLPNGTFEAWKSACGNSYSSSNGELSPAPRPGVEPEGWNGSSVSQMGIVKVELVTRGGDDSDAHTVMTNKFAGFLGIGSNAPAYVTFGNPWVFANIMDVDVGRPISHLSLMPTYPNWQEDVKTVFESRQPLDREISEPGGRYWLVRIRPYRTDYNSVEGIIMTFMEATDLRMMRNSTFVNAGLMYWQRENSQITHWRYNPNNYKCTVTITGDNEQEKQLEVKPEEFYQTIHPDDRKHIESAVNELKTTEIKQCELTCRVDNRCIYNEPCWIYMQIYKIEKEENGGIEVLQGTVNRL